MDRAPTPKIHWPAIIAWVVTTLAAAAAGWIHGNSCGCRPAHPLPPIPFRGTEQNSALSLPDAEAAELLPALGVVAGDIAQGEHGWLGQRADLPRPPCRRFADTPAGRAGHLHPIGDEEDPDVYLWLAAVKVTGKPLPARNQLGVGSCVGFGTTCALEYLACMQVALGREEQFREQVQESLYGLSRVQIGGGRIRGDGSIGSWAAEAAKQYGVLARAAGYESYDQRRCRQWGAQGPPKDLIGLIKEHPCKDYAQCLSAADVRAALRAGYPIAVSSGQGFSSHRDADGFARAAGSWPHCMAIIGYRGGSRKGFFVENSWGPSWISGPTYPAGDDAPPEGGFWADWNVVDRMARQQDTFAFSDLAGFPAANPWIVQRHRRPPRWCWLRLRLLESRRDA